MPLRGRGRAFTLIEILVVAGVIAILIGILLPVVAAAKRDASRARCLASLKEIGNGFKLYANDFKGAWPVALHQQGAAPPLLPEERRWYDLLASYVAHGRAVSKATDIAELRRNSVIWGCPEWAKSKEYDPNSAADKLQVGYAMQYQPTVEYDTRLQNFAYITGGAGGIVGQYVKGTTWGRRSADRGVIGCSSQYLVIAKSTFSKTTGEWLPFPQANPAEPQLLLDSTRHLKSGTSKTASVKQRGLNMLFADGHAQPVSIVEAWNALRWPGQDRSDP